MKKQLKALFVLIITSIVSPKLYAMGEVVYPSVDLFDVNYYAELERAKWQAVLDDVENAISDNWKAIILFRALNTTDQIEALDAALAKKASETRDSDLAKKLTESRKGYNSMDERAAVLQSVLPPKDYIEALKNKVASKIQS